MTPFVVVALVVGCTSLLIGIFMAGFTLGRFFERVEFIRKGYRIPREENGG